MEKVGEKIVGYSKGSPIVEMIFSETKGIEVAHFNLRCIRLEIKNG